MDAKGKRMNELAEQMDKLDNLDREFIFWYIMPEINAKFRKMIGKLEDCTEMKDVLAHMEAKTIYMNLEKAKDILGYDLF